MIPDPISLTDLVQFRSIPNSDAFATEVGTGLHGVPKHLSSQYFYDANGMRLFQEIMIQPEYYLTSCEDRILRASREALHDALPGGPLNILDLGSGDASKTRILLEYFLSVRNNVRYFPVDISVDTLRELLVALPTVMPTLPVHGVAAEYFDALQWIGEHKEGRKLVLFLGSNIGNFPPEKARNFLHRLHDVLRNGDLVLIGFDTKKDPRIIARAYDDSAGVTARFNLNLLARINRELGGEFDLSAFHHYSYYDEIAGAARSFLVSSREQHIRIAALDETIAFDAWESIHTEDSWKYSPRDIASLASDTGFDIVRDFTDDGRQFIDSLWRVRIP